MPWLACDEVQMVVPASRTSATAHDGPSDAWLWFGQKYVAESVLAAPAIAASTSPRFTTA